jgi:hypothetical protein
MQIRMPAGSSRRVAMQGRNAPDRRAGDFTAAAAGHPGRDRAASGMPSSPTSQDSPVAPPSINVRLRELAQLFNSMDPSPFHDRDLDAAAEDFIVSWARELPAAADFELVIHLEAPPPPDRARDVGDAVRHYFSSRAEMKQREFRQLMRRGRMSLGVGLGFLAVCLTASELLGTIAREPYASMVKESLLIVGWVAMWRPLEIYLYDWWPLRDERRVLDRLGRMRVRLVMRDSGPAVQPGRADK